jgi:receptor expression-enhancing protein 5/6
MNLKSTFSISGGAVLVALYIAFGYAGQILCNVIGVAYPTYVSMKAIESKQTTDDTKWLTYWVMFSCFTIFEEMFVFVTNFIPFYWLLKVIWKQKQIPSGRHINLI